MSWAARPVCGRRVGNTYLEHRFSAFSALLAHGRFGEVRTSPSYTAALAQQYLRYRAGLHLLHREVETAVWRMCVLVGAPRVLPAGDPDGIVPTSDSDARGREQLVRRVAARRWQTV